MFLFTFLAKINPESRIAHDAEFKDVGGAYVNAWIHFKEYEGAEMLAKFYIEEECWTIERKTKHTKIKKKHCKKKKDKQYYRETLDYGYSLVFNMWRKNAEDADTDYEEEDGMIA